MQIFVTGAAFPADAAISGRKVAVAGRRPAAALGRTRLEARLSARRDLNAVTDRLIAEFAGRLPAGTVIRHVGRAREQLLAAGVRAGLASTAEAMARSRLRTLLPAHGAVR